MTRRWLKEFGMAVVLAVLAAVIVEAYWRAEERSSGSGFELNLRYRKLPPLEVPAAEQPGRSGH